MSRLKTTVGQLLVNDALPPDMRDYSRTINKKELGALLRELAINHPDEYREVSHKLADIGWHAAFTSGGQSFGLRHIQASPSAIKNRAALRRVLHRIYSNESLPEEEKDKRVLAAVGRLSELQEGEIFDEQKAAGNPLADQVESGSRGNRMNLASLLGSDLLYTDHHGRVIPFPVLRSYSQGLTPAEYWAGAYGARKGVIDLKLSTQDAGFLCLAKGTLIRMADWSAKPIEAIRTGDRILGADRKGRTFPTEVTATFANGKRKLKKFRFRYGKSRTRFLEITATDSHKALCEHLRRRRKRPDPKLRIEILTDVMPLGSCERKSTSWHSLVPSQGYANRGGKREPLAGIIGLLIAEGGLTTNQIGLSCGDDELLEAVKTYVGPRGFSVRKKTGADYEYSIVDEEPLPHEGSPGGGGGIALGSFRNRLRKKLASLGLDRKSASEKTIPSEVDSWNNASVAELLRWLFAGDGGVGASNNSSTPTVTLGMTAAPVVRKAQELLASRFGIYGQLCVIRTKGRSCGHPTKDYRANHDVVSLSISDRESVQRFAKKIGFVVGAKQTRLQALLKKIEPCGRRDRFLFHFAGSSEVGFGETFDLEVAHPDHLFVLANGAIVSNSKQLAQIVHRGLITALDSEPDPERPKQIRGLPVDADDIDNEGALLAQAIGGYRQNQVLTPKILEHLLQQGIKRILVRSPTVGGADDGGLYARDVGIREFSRLPTVGENVSLAAVQALSEPLTQAQISSKHSGGVATAHAAKAIGGFDHINQLVQVPKIFKGGAAHAEQDGTVQTIEEAPAGGHYVIINGEKHYVGSGYELKVKPGDKVEAGDVISEGTPNPAIIVKHKGIGEGRRYFVRAFRDAFREAGLGVHRRNVELLARGLINHVRLTSEAGDHNPDDVIAYGRLEHTYKPRPEARKMLPSRAIGQHLERPALHYTIGTRIRPSVAKELEEFGVNEIEVHDEPPPFEAEMIRGMANLQHDPDWLTRMYGSGLQKGLFAATHRGAISDPTGTSFVPGLAQSSEFGRTGKVITPKREGARIKLSALQERVRQNKAVKKATLEELRARVKETQEKRGQYGTATGMMSQPEYSTPPQRIATAVTSPVSPEAAELYARIYAHTGNELDAWRRLRNTQDEFRENWTDKLPPSGPESLPGIVEGGLWWSRAWPLMWAASSLRQRAGIDDEDRGLNRWYSWDTAQNLSGPGRFEGLPRQEDISRHLLPVPSGETGIREAFENYNYALRQGKVPDADTILSLVDTMETIRAKDPKAAEALFPPEAQARIQAIMEEDYRQRSRYAQREADARHINQLVREGLEAEGGSVLPAWMAGTGGTYGPEQRRSFTPGGGTIPLYHQYASSEKASPEDFARLVLEYESGRNYQAEDQEVPPQFVGQKTRELLKTEAGRAELERRRQRLMERAQQRIDLADLGQKLPVGPVPGTIAVAEPPIPGGTGRSTPVGSITRAQTRTQPTVTPATPDYASRFAEIRRHHESNPQSLQDLLGPEKELVYNEYASNPDKYPTLDFYQDWLRSGGRLQPPANAETTPPATPAQPVGQMPAMDTLQDAGKAMEPAPPTAPGAQFRLPWQDVRKPQQMWEESGQNPYGILPWPTITPSQQQPAQSAQPAQQPAAGGGVFGAVRRAVTGPPKQPQPGQQTQLPPMRGLFPLYQAAPKQVGQFIRSTGPAAPYAMAAMADIDAFKTLTTPKPGGKLKALPAAASKIKPNPYKPAPV